nr:unnamed protein product [Spirometra erinaceieuropaei]
MEKFLGSWKLSKSEGFDAITERLGFSLAHRTATKTLHPVMTIARDGDGYSLKMSTTFKTHEFSFKLGEEFDLTTMDGRHVKSIFTLEGDTLKQVDTGEKITYIDRVVEGNTIKLTTRVDELVSVRYYTKDLAIETIKLLLQSKYDETENRLGHAQIIQLLKLCLRTYFTFDGTIYEQVKGTPMDSPISGFIAEAVLQRLESLVFQHHRPKFWVGYVDDTFVVIERDQVLTFQEHLNAVFPDIQFTMEEEENNQLAFLDVLVCRKDCGGLKTKVFRKATNTMQDWFVDNDAAIRNLLAEKNRLHKVYVDHTTDSTKAAFYRSCRQIQQRLREMQDAWTASKAEEIEGYADRNELKNFFSAIKAVYGPPTKGTAPLLSTDGNTLLTEKTQILQRWAEHFRGLLNRPSAISDAAIERLPQVETNVDLDLPP